MSPLDRINKWLYGIMILRPPPAVLKVAIDLAKRCNQSTSQCYPAHSTIAKSCFIEKRTAEKATAWLEANGFLRIKRNAVGERKDKKTNLYTFVLPINNPSKETPRSNERPVLLEQNEPSARTTKQDKEHDNNISTKQNRQKAFMPPDFEEVKEYFKSRQYDQLAEDFYYYFDGREWHDSKDKKVKRWKGNAATWISNHKKNNPTPKPYQPRQETKPEKF